MWVCIHIEVILTYSIFFSVLGLLFPQAFTDINFDFMLNPGETEQSKVWYFATLGSAVVTAGLVAPFYVGAGFIVYINRRMSLEAWDVEHRFRRIKPRTAASLGTALLVCLIALSPNDASAENRAQFLPPITSISNTIVELQADEGIGTMRTVKRLRFKDDFAFDGSDDSSSFDSFWDPQGLIRLLISLVENFQIFIWVVAAIFIVLLLYTIRGFRKPNLNLSPLSRGDSDSADAVSHPLTADLPTNIPAAAQKLLNEGNRRQALSVLFRGALRAVMNQYELKILRGATESDCQKTIGAVANDQQVSLFNRLLVIWQREAYANDPQDEQHISVLINDWSAAFNTPQQTDAGGPAQ
jgi:hypothetical protein